MSYEEIQSAFDSAGGWRKSSRSQGQNTCVEVGSAPGLVGVRDSKLGEDGPVLAFMPDQWRAFVVSVTRY